MLAGASSQSITPQPKWWLPSPPDKGTTDAYVSTWARSQDGACSY